MDQPSRPHKPEAEERDNYFFGLSGRPKLIARTSSHQWSFPKHEEGWGGYRPSRKRYATIGEHGILSRWNKELSLEVAAVLKECSWSYFFPIRIGLENIQDTLPYPVVLLAAVEDVGMRRM
ncbi:hypothetical protein F5X96DRAFT_617507 [Biscogniauxia mediterranea]|nr:hypothetical protein F5X96DRAFT_617507 [Biscogniauxia mediterranea]